jgi:hypothetical protein
MYSCAYLRLHFQEVPENGKVPSGCIVHELFTPLDCHWHTWLFPELDIPKGSKK